MWSNNILCVRVGVLHFLFRKSVELPELILTMILIYISCMVCLGCLQYFYMKLHVFS